MFKDIINTTITGVEETVQIALVVCENIIPVVRVDLSANNSEDIIYKVNLVHYNETDLHDNKKKSYIKEEKYEQLNPGDKYFVSTLNIRVLAGLKINLACIIPKGYDANGVNVLVKMETPVKGLTVTPPLAEKINKDLAFSVGLAFDDDFDNIDSSAFNQEFDKYPLVFTIKEEGREIEIGKVYILLEERLKGIIEELIYRIKKNLGKTDDYFLRQAFINADILRNIVSSHDRNDGGAHTHGIIYIGNYSFVDKNTALNNSDDDVMATIFHEFMHYIAYKENIYPVRYDDTNHNLIYSEIVALGKKQTYDNDYYNAMYMEYLIKECGNNKDKYEEYPTLYDDLEGIQKQEVDKYINKMNISPESMEDYYQYKPSNFSKDEINAHKKTLDVQELHLYNMSNSKVGFYLKEIQKYEEIYNKCLHIEQILNYGVDGNK